MWTIVRKVIGRRMLRVEVVRRTLSSDDQRPSRPRPDAGGGQTVSIRREVKREQKGQTSIDELYQGRFQGSRTLGRAR